MIEPESESLPAGKDRAVFLNSIYKLSIIIEL
jgi:hypothetical protein